MKQVNIERFLEDYQILLSKKADILATKDNAIAAEKEKAETIIAQGGYSEAIKEILVKEIVAEKEKEYDTTKIDSDIAIFETYIEDVEEVADKEVCEDAAEEVSTDFVG